MSIKKMSIKYFNLDSTKIKPQLHLLKMYEVVYFRNRFLKLLNGSLTVEVMLKHMLISLSLNKKVKAAVLKMVLLMINIA